SRTKDGTSETANALRFEDKAGEEQLWIQAQKNMDTNVKNDETHSVGGNQTVAIMKSYNSTVSGSYDQKTQWSRNELVGGDYIMKTQGAIVQASAHGISLVAGESVLTLLNNGTVSLQCKNFEVNATGRGQINTGGTLDLNISTPGKSEPAQPTPEQIASAVSDAFKNGGNSA
ncbi:bacteriophage T4 gp5 trimerisation domain-containing protein, partial [Erwinia psidii]